MILFYVQHLLGTGHVHRVRRIAKELFDRGEPVSIISGGMPVADLAFDGEVVQLEPIRSSGVDFGELVDQSGRVVDDDLFARRGRTLQEAYERLRPAVIVIESYPFGRRQFRYEIKRLLDLAEASRNRPRVVCSIRDVLHQRAIKRELESVDVINGRFGAVLVHGDPSFIPLEASFAMSEKISEKIVYTGYVAPAPVPRTVLNAANGGEVVISAGGGAAGQVLYQASLRAANMDRSGCRYRFLIGSGVPEEIFDELRKSADSHIHIERNRADFRELIAESAILVSQAGYNTITDIMATGVPSLLVPFEGQGETEQLLRASRLEEIGRCRVLRESQLEPALLLSKISEILSAPEPDFPDMSLEGVTFSADWLAAAAQ